MEYELLSAEDCCAYYHIEYHFLELLHEHNLIDLVNVDAQYYLHVDALRNLETLMRMHYELDINLEGIEVINNLLSRVNKLHQQITHLKNKLKVYEEQNF
jgi:chaperone modulatory protein CbpM